MDIAFVSTGKGLPCIALWECLIAMGVCIIAGNTQSHMVGAPAERLLGAVWPSRGNTYAHSLFIPPQVSKHCMSVGFVCLLKGVLFVVPPWYAYPRRAE